MTTIIVAILSFGAGAGFVILAIYLSDRRAWRVYDSAVIEYARELAQADAHGMSWGRVTR